MAKILTKVLLLLVSGGHDFQYDFDSLEAGEFFPLSFRIPRFELATVKFFLLLCSEFFVLLVQSISCIRRPYFCSS